MKNFLTTKYTLRELFQKRASMNKGGDVKEIKPYSEVKVGDMAMENPDAGGEWNNEQGMILWKGTYAELNKSKYKNTLTDWEEEDVDPSDYDLVVVQREGWDGGPTLFNYNNDPSGCVVFEDTMAKGGKFSNYKVGDRVEFKAPWGMTDGTVKEVTDKYVEIKEGDSKRVHKITGPTTVKLKKI